MDHVETLRRTFIRCTRGARTAQNQPVVLRHPGDTIDVVHVGLRSPLWLSAGCRSFEPRSSDMLRLAVCTKSSTQHLALPVTVTRSTFVEKRFHHGTFVVLSVRASGSNISVTVIQAKLGMRLNYGNTVTGRKIIGVEEVFQFPSIRC